MKRWRCGPRPRHHRHSCLGVGSTRCPLATCLLRSLRRSRLASCRPFHCAYLNASIMKERYNTGRYGMTPQGTRYGTARHGTQRKEFRRRKTNQEEREGRKEYSDAVICFTRKETLRCADSFRTSTKTIIVLWESTGRLKRIGGQGVRDAVYGLLQHNCCAVGGLPD